MTPAERRSLVLALLDHWPDFFDVAGGTAAVASTGEGGGGLPAVSSMSRHPSVRELARLLEWLRKHGRGHYWAVRDYFDSPWRTTGSTIRKRLPSGRWAVVEGPRVRQRVLSRELQRYPVCLCGCGMPRPVCLGVDVVSGAWSPTVILELPWPLLAKLRPLADSEGWTEAAA